LKEVGVVEEKKLLEIVVDSWSGVGFGCSKNTVRKIHLNTDNTLFIGLTTHGYNFLREISGMYNISVDSFFEDLFCKYTRQYKIGRIRIDSYYPSFPNHMIAKYQWDIISAKFGSNEHGMCNHLSDFLTLKLCCDFGISLPIHDCNSNEYVNACKILSFYKHSKLFINAKDLPPVAGIYAVLARIENKIEFIHVGKSKNVEQRCVNYHQIPEVELMKKLGINVFYRVMYSESGLIQFTDEQLDQIERTLIAATNPKLNNTPVYNNKVVPITA